MITLKINDKDYRIKTSWEDVPYSFYAELKNPYATEKKLLQKIAWYSGIDIETIASFTLEQLDMIIGLIGFMETELTMFKKLEITTDIKKETWFKYEKSKQIFTKVENPYLAIAEVVREYLNLDILDKPVTEVYAYADFFFHNSTLFRNDTKD